ncbi:MAG TPA: hypothetical protein VER96_12565 [Polyangiaceae bacterium]|nr:hypothetical protein [Polyangiaceae bacterium]
MSNSPTLPPAAEPQRKPTPLPVLANESDARLQAALAASARADASLTGLFRAIQQLGNGLGGAREANESLTLELEGLRDLLGVASEQQQIFERKISELEQVLDRTRKEHSQERGYLIDQQDLFLVKLLDEQELELKQRDLALEALRGRLAKFEERNQLALAPTMIQESAPTPPVTLVEPEQPPVSTLSKLERAERDELERTAQKLAEDRERARETVSRLQAQRDEAQDTVVRIGRERDELLYEIHRLRSELGGPRIPLSTRPPSGESRSSSGRMPAAQSLSQLELEARLGQPGVPSSAPSASATFPTAGHDSQRSQPISSILSPPAGTPFTAPLSSRLSPPPSRLSPPPPAQPSIPPEELRHTLTSTLVSSTGPTSSEPPVESRSSPLKQKPDASTRPLVGYSLGTGSVKPESLESATHLTPHPPPSSGKR